MLTSPLLLLGKLWTTILSSTTTQPQTKVTDMEMAEDNADAGNLPLILDDGGILDKFSMEGGNQTAEDPIDKRNYYETSRTPWQ